MASACVNNVGISPETFLDRSPAKLPSYAWLSPRKSCSRVEKQPEKPRNGESKHVEDDDKEELGDFEFCLEDNFTMLPADELFLNGKLMPLQLSMAKREVAASSGLVSGAGGRVITEKVLSRNGEISIMDPYLFSPKAPRCTTRWKELLGLRKLYQKEKEKEKENNNKSSSPTLATSSSTASKSIKNLLNRSSKASLTSSLDCSVNLPLLKDSDNEYISISSSRLSLSSSSSSHDHDDLPRLSLDADNKPGSGTLPRVLLGNHQTRAPGARVINKPKRPTPSSSDKPSGGARATRSTMRRNPDNPNQEQRVISADSPRMNASGKIVFHNLERSSSSPSSYGGPRYKHSSGVQRSYSANVRVTPVLNVPVCSLRGSGSGGGVFGLFGSSTTQPKRDSFGSISGSGSSNKNGIHNQTNNKHRKDRN